MDRVSVVTTLSPTLDIDADSRPDGLVAAVYFWSLEQAPSVPAKGGLTVKLYEGKVSLRELGTVTPLETWTFTLAELAPLARRTLYGAAYELQLLWTGRAPASGRVTLLAEYLRPDGTVLRSAPNTIPLGPQ